MFIIYWNAHLGKCRVGAFICAQKWHPMLIRYLGNTFWGSTFWNEMKSKICTGVEEADRCVTVLRGWLFVLLCFWVQYFRPEIPRDAEDEGEISHKKKAADSNVRLPSLLGEIHNTTNDHIPPQVHKCWEKSLVRHVMVYVHTGYVSHLVP